MFAYLLVAVTAGQPLSRTLTVTPAADPRPALRYELLPSYRHRVPGNAALSYFRAFAARPKPPSDPAELQTQQDAVEKWLAGSLDQLAKDDVRKYLTESARMLRELDRAVAADHCDWELLPRLKTEGIEAVFEVNQSRELIRALSLRTRLELAEDRFGDAAKSLRTAVQMARHVGEGPTHLQLLVGLAMQSITLERVDDWISRPGSPNLYWALTNLPRPLIDPWPGIHGEQAFMESRVPNLIRLRDGPVPKEQANEIVDGVMADLRNMGGGPVKLDPIEDAVTRTIGRFGAAAYVAWRFPTARAEMLALGRTDADLDAMAPAQVVFLASFERFAALRDDYLKWVGVPYHRAWPELKMLNARVAAEQAANNTDVFFAVFALSLPSTEKMIWAVARTDRRVQFLRTLEAVRLHAAANRGKPPEKLSEVTLVPVPDDPVTGRPFGYELKGDVVILTGGPPAGEKEQVANSLRYEITLLGSKK